MAGRSAAGSGARRPDGFAGGVALKWERRMWARRERNTDRLQIVGPSAPGRAAARPPPPSPQRGGEHRSRSAARRARRHDSGRCVQQGCADVLEAGGRGAARPGSAQALLW